jgi:wyosine [tRNA(Phe)-imidazoG37] synthetase (radical SAM superfamily)
MNVIFGPVNSRRFGKSLGVDLSPSKKQCNFDCLYCELAPAKTVDAYEDVISVEEVVAQIKEVLKEHKDIDVLTITANGEPTLYPHLSELMDKINAIKGETKTLILSNAANVDEKPIQNALMKFDTVKLSLDCATARCLKRLDRAHKGIDVEAIKQGMLTFKESYIKPLVIEILFVKGVNDSAEEIEALNQYLLKLQPTRIDISTIDRPPAYYVEPLDYQTLHAIALEFDASLSLYIASRKTQDVKPSSYSQKEIIETIKKRPLTQGDIELLFDEESKNRLEKLLEEKVLKIESSSGYDFFVENNS